MVLWMCSVKLANALLLAVTLAKTIGAGMLIPVHHDLYEVNQVSPAYFVDVLMKINRTQRYHIFVPGERYIYAK